MTAAQDFQADPVEFMKQNLLLIQFGQHLNGYNDEGPHYFELIDCTGIYQCQTAGTKRVRDIPVYAIQQTTIQGPNAISSYWLPFQLNRMFRIVLEDDTNLMLTARMDGCSFGFTDFKNGIFTVSHGNLQNHDESIDVPGLKLLMTHEKHVLHRSGYKTTKTIRDVGNDRIKVTTFGVRDGNKWKFYYQQYEHPQNQLNLTFHGVHRIS